MRQLSLIYSAAMILLHITTKLAAFKHAKSLITTKGIINLGSIGSLDPFSEMIAKDEAVKFNVDLRADSQPHFYQHDLEQPLPFADKEFDVAFMSHILEHLENWEQALSEAVRVADYVVIVLPSPISLANWFAKEHKQHFLGNDARQIELTYPSVRVFL